MKSVLVTIPGYFKLLRPVSWRDESAEGILSIYSDDGVGVIQASVATNRTGSPPDIAQLLRAFVTAHHLTNLTFDDAPGGLTDRRRATGVAEGTFWDVMQVGAAGRAALLTYNCSEPDRNVEAPERNLVFRSFRLLKHKPER